MNRGIAHSRTHQRGAALLALTAVMVLAGAWLTVKITGDDQSRTIVERAHNNTALQEAKAALIGYVAQRALLFEENYPGRLPCPESAANSAHTNPDYHGVAATSCTLPAVGRLPWRTLGLPKLVDRAGEPLWYVVSSGWALPTDTATIQINSNTTGQLAVDGALPATLLPTNTHVALIIAPGPSIVVSPNASQMTAGCVSRTQTRSSMPPDLRDYLECENATYPADSTFVTTVVDNTTNPVMNDQVMRVTAAEILGAIEGPVAARIEQYVVPHLQSFGQSAWTSSTSTPVYPFAAPFSNPASSSFEGSANSYQGLMPLTRGQNCTPGTDLDCDPSFVQWNTASITVTKVSGTPNIVSYTCAASSASQISCTIVYRRSSCSTTCNSGTMRVRIVSSALNVGMGMKTRATSFSGSTGWTVNTLPSSSALTLDTSGRVSLSYTGTLPTQTCTGSGCTVSRTVLIPMPTFPDHWFLNPTGPTAGTPHDWWWFLNGKWHHNVYYAVAPNHTPAGAVHRCTDGVDCLSIGNLTPSNKQRAVLIFAGRTLTGTARPNATLADFLDDVSASGISSGINRDNDTTFYKATPGSTFNDRFIVVDANP